MPIINSADITTVPTADQKFVDRLRVSLRDTEALNILEQSKESTDIELYVTILDALDEINLEYAPATSFTLTSEELGWNLLKMGATIQVLISHGIHSSRNKLTYTDVGGVTIQDMDKFGRYINWYNVFINKYIRTVTSFKVRINIDSCYGGVHSEYYYTDTGENTLRNR